MHLQLSHEEHAYIVDCPETDLFWTQLSMKLIEAPRGEGRSVVVDGTESDYEEFLNNLREEFIWKSTRLKNPEILTGLARRLLPDFESLKPMEFY
jgi:hypothetical protein